jgi:hypothetical protein
MILYDGEKNETLIIFYLHLSCDVHCV